MTTLKHNCGAICYVRNVAGLVLLIIQMNYSRYVRRSMLITVVPKEKRTDCSRINLQTNIVTVR